MPSMVARRKFVAFFMENKLLTSQLLDSFVKRGKKTKANK
jgi:hypothetical protein